MLDDNPSTLRSDIYLYSTTSHNYFFWPGILISKKEIIISSMTCNGMPPIIVDIILCCACMEPFFGNHGDQIPPPSHHSPLSYCMLWSIENSFATTVKYISTFLFLFLFGHMVGGGGGTSLSEAPLSEVYHQVPLFCIQTSIPAKV